LAQDKLGCFRVTLPVAAYAVPDAGSFVRDNGPGSGSGYKPFEQIEVGVRDRETALDAFVALVKQNTAFAVYDTGDIGSVGDAEGVDVGFARFAVSNPSTAQRAKADFAVGSFWSTDYEVSTAYFASLVFGWLLRLVLSARAACRILDMALSRAETAAGH
jgi:hypothetical protein